MHLKTKDSTERPKCGTSWNATKVRSCTMDFPEKFPKKNCRNASKTKHFKNKTLPEVLNKVEVQKADVLFIEPGTIHAIGKGNVIAEIQQNSNVTYHVFDYGRKGPDGKEHDLHIEKALQVTRTVPILRKKSFEPHIVSCPYFTVDKLVLDGQRVKKVFGEIDKTSFVSILVMEGKGTIRDKEETLTFKKGDSLFVTANISEYELEGAFEALVTTV